VGRVGGIAGDDDVKVIDPQDVFDLGVEQGARDQGTMPQTIPGWDLPKCPAHVATGRIPEGGTSQSVDRTAPNTAGDHTLPGCAPVWVVQWGV
jgi:hypothetical protein